jgi:hypothetical protein
MMPKHEQRDEKRWRMVAALKRRAAFRVIDGGRIRAPHALDAPALEPRARPMLRLLRGGRADEPVRRAPAVVLEVPRRRSRA